VRQFCTLDLLSSVQYAPFSIDRDTLDEAFVSGCKRSQTDHAVRNGNK